MGSSRFTGLNMGPGCDEDDEGDGSILECAAGGGGGCWGCDWGGGGGGGTGEGR